ncbi:MAG: hypothetical protein KDH95_22535 [Calditrichaeota bacterium]|nr:hypothetical protein [Calditrichota bacterium]MCB0270954.1 hypothetical protein [Calditrichota bacterium]
MKSIKVLYTVSCSCGEQFEKAFEIEEGSVQISTDVQAFCPFCGEYVTATVKGKVLPDIEILRAIEKKIPRK